MARRACRSADEFDAFTGWRRVYQWRPGERSRIKRRANRRERRTELAAARAEGGAVLAGYAPPADSVPVLLSPGELYPACCPWLVIVDEEGEGAAALLARHRAEAH